MIDVKVAQQKLEELDKLAREGQANAVEQLVVEFRKVLESYEHLKHTYLSARLAVQHMRKEMSRMERREQARWARERKKP